MSDVARARRLLARPGAWIEAEGAAYRVRSGPKLRGRETVLDEAGFRALIAEPGLKLRPGGGWIQRRGRIVSDERVGRPGVVEGERLQAEDGRLIARRANLAHSPVVWLARRSDPDGRPWLGPTEVAAAHRLAAEAEIALKGPSLTMRWDALPRSGGGSAARVEPNDRAIAASRRVEAALAACGTARSIVDAVCIRSTALQAAEQGLGLRRRQGRALLIAGLRALAAHYRIG